MFGMFEKSPSSNALDLLKSDHDEVERLFDEFEEQKESAQDTVKERLVEAICSALEAHAQLEEELFYPALRKIEGMEELLDEAEVEHASVKELVAQLQRSSAGTALYDARVTVLSEYVKHHVREEEGEIFPKVRASDVDLEKLGEKFAARKEQLQQQMPAPMETTSGRGRGAGSRNRSAKTTKRTSKTASAQATARKTTRKSTSTGKRTTARTR